MRKITKAPSESLAKEAVHIAIHDEFDHTTFKKMKVFAFHEEEYASCCFKGKIEEFPLEFIVYSFTIRGSTIYSYIFPKIYTWNEVISLYLEKLEIVKKVSKDIFLDKKFGRERM